MEDGVSYTLLSPPLWSRMDSSKLSDRLHALGDITKNILAPIEPSKGEEGNRAWRVVLWQSLISAFVRPRYLEGRWKGELRDSIRRISVEAIVLEHLRADLCSSLRELAPFNSPESQVININLSLSILYWFS